MQDRGVYVGKIVLEEKVRYSQESYLSDILFKSDNVQLELLCLEEGQEIISQTANSQVIILVVSGSGSINSGTVAYDLKPGLVIICEGMEKFGTKAHERMVILQYVIPPP